MTKSQRKAITSEQWDDAAASYEFGYKHAVEIAQELGVSAATVSREFKRRGCRKGSRLHELVAQRHAELDAEDQQKARRRETEALARFAAMDALVGELMDMLVTAERAGQLASANAEITRIGKALQVHMR
jgi:IS30 family transposase